MKFLILGAGAIGGYVGGRLAAAGGDVTFLVREGRRRQLESDGLRIESTLGNLSLAVRAVGADALEPRYDLVLMAAKAYDLESAMAAVKPGLGPSGVVLPVLNGIGHIERLNAAFGPERVLGGTAKISITLLPDGRVKHMNDWRWITFGEQAGGWSERVKAIAAAFAPAEGLEARPSPAIMQEMWEKLVHLATAAAMTCLMRANVGQIIRAAEGARLFQGLLETMAEVARRHGHPPGEAFLANQREHFADPTAAYATSMLRDIERGGRIEGDEIVGWSLAAARRVGLEDPLLATAYAHLKAYENRRADGGL